MEGSQSPASIKLTASHQTVQSTALSETGNSIWGTTTFYPISISLPADGKSINSFALSNGYETITFPVQNQLFFSPSLSSISAPGSTGLVTVNITAAAAGASTEHGDVLSARLDIPKPQQGTLAPKMTSQSLRLEPFGKVGAFTLYSSSVTLNESLISQASVDISGIMNGKEVVDEFNRLNTISGAPAAFSHGILIG